MTMNRIIRTVLLIIAGVLIIIGLKFTSTGVGPGNLMQNDGFNVTGGLLTLIGGMLVGFLLSDSSSKK